MLKDENDSASSVKTIPSRIRGSVVSLGGTVSYYVVGPIINYVAEPVVKNATVPVVAAAGAAIATLPVSTPVMLGLVVTAGFAIPRVINYQVANAQQRTRRFGEIAAEGFLSGSKSALTFLYNTTGDLASGVYHKLVAARVTDPMQVEYRDKDENNGSDEFELVDLNNETNNEFNNELRLNFG